MADGFSSTDLDKPPTRAELTEAEKDHVAYTTWYQTGSLAKVKRALDVRTDRAALVRLNRAIQERREAMEDVERAVFQLGSERLLQRWLKLEIAIDNGDSNNHDAANATWDRVARLHNLNKTREDTAQATLTVITQLPAGVAETIFGEAGEPTALPEPTDAEIIED